MSLCPDSCVQKVLHTPMFPKNLLSISQITEDLKCRVIFYSDSCFSRPINWKEDWWRPRRWRTLLEDGGLYYVDVPLGVVFSSVDSKSTSYWDALICS